MPKAFISFLGTNNYLNCRYELDHTPGNVVKYVQEDIIARFCNNWSSSDEIRIFTTDDARRNNWDDDGHRDRKTNEIIPDAGLGKRLEAMAVKASIKQYDIPVGNSEAEIWDIFQAVYDSLGEGDEIIFDITHGFRSIPMLFMVLIGYARLLKGITVEGIYYGAFETLGNWYDVKQIPEDERIAPIFDLTSFEQLIEWTEATQSFLKNGSATAFAALAKRKLSPVLKVSRGQDQVASAINDIVKGIDAISLNLLLNRGADIIQYDYERVKGKLNALQNDDVFIRPLAPLMSVVGEKIDGFTMNDIHNGFKAVDWCVDHGLYQQAITMLLENMITFILAEANLDWGLEMHRNAASSAITLVSDKSKVLDNSRPDSDLIRTLLTNPVVLEFAGEFQTLRSIRNDLNHGGYLTEKNKKARNAASILEKFRMTRNSIRQKLCK